MSHPVVDRRGLRRIEPGGRRALGARSGSRLYGLGVRLADLLWAAGLRRPQAASLPVVSVGSLTVGGSGKTPFVRWLARRLLEDGQRPAILSRGYRSSGGARPRVVDPERPDVRRDGDEPCLLARSLPDVPGVVSPDRLAASRLAAARGADVLLLDDGFQHRRLSRDVDIVLWDRGAELSYGRLLPAGFLREPLTALARADAIVLVDRGNGVPEAPAGGPGPDCTFVARLRTTTRHPLEPGTRVHALSGIADPASFERALGGLGLTVTGATRHADHHPFTLAEVREAARRAAGQEAAFLAVTAKDRVRWPRDPDGSIPVPAVFDLEVEVEKETELLGLIRGAIPRESS